MTVRETERKYESAEPPGAELIAALAAAAGGPAPAAPTRVDLSATYWDTVDLRLLRSRLTLRRRVGGARRGVAPQAARRGRQPRRGPPPAGPQPQAARPAGRAEPCRAPGRTAAARRRARHGPPGVDADRRAGRGGRHRHRRPGHRPHPRRGVRRRHDRGHRAPRVGRDRGRAGRARHPRGARPDRGRAAARRRAPVGVGLEAGPGARRAGPARPAATRREPGRDGGPGRARLRGRAGRDDPRDGPAGPPRRPGGGARHARGLPADAQLLPVVPRAARPQPHRRPRRGAALARG